MDPDRKRIEEDLRGLVAGDVFCDDLFVQMYASDASVYQIRPLGVVRPRTTGDVVAAVQYARENEIPVHPRGAGTGLAGESLGRGLVIDFSRYMRRVIHVGAEQVRVQAGVVHGDLNRVLARHGRVFGPDPALSHVTTMGGVVSVDASGSHWLRFGSTRKHVKSLKIVLADGEVLEVSRHSIKENSRAGEPPRLRELVSGVTRLIQRHQEVIQRYRPQSLVNRSGYALDRVLEEEQLDLAKLIVGSEGTLALVSEITVATSPSPARRGCVLLLFDSLDKAARAAGELVPLGPSACDLMDRRHLSLARETDVRYELMIPGAAEAILLVEQTADDDESLRHKLQEIVDVAQQRSGLAASAQVAHDEQDNLLFWQLAQRFAPTLHRLRGNTRPVPCIEDIAVPPTALPVFLRHLQDTLKQHQVTASLFAHAGHGQLHIRPFLDLASPEHISRMESLASDLYEKVWLLGGTISGEHGDGLSRTPFLSRQYGPLVNVFRELKRIFDPSGILNPGKVVPTAGARMTHQLRPLDQLPQNGAAEEGASGEEPRLETVELQLDWSLSQVAREARSCNGCGACRTNAEEVRMCPTFHYAPREEASPRSKANLMRGVLAGDLPWETLLTEEAKAVADLCVHCHMCRLECPANVDIPRMMLEAKGAYVRTNGMKLQDWLLTRLDGLMSVASRSPRAANWMLRDRRARWLLEKFVGLAQGRKLPAVAHRPFLRNVGRKYNRATSDNPHRVAYFVDTFANYFDPELAESLVRILRHNGIDVHIPPNQRHAAMTMITQGVLDPARRIAERNVAQLAELARAGYTIVATEPTATLALTHEYPILLDDDEDSVLVAQATQDACHYLWQLHQRGALKLDFGPLNLRAAYHVPCHLRALGVGAPAENLLRLIPEFRLTRLEKGCSGMAGIYGLRRANYRSSLRIGLPLMSTLRDGPFQIGTTECSACRTQMEQSTPKRTIHPIKLLAIAYGLMPPAEQVQSAMKLEQVGA